MEAPRFMPVPRLSRLARHIIERGVRCKLDLLFLICVFLAIQMYLGLGVSPTRTPDSAIFEEMSRGGLFGSRCALLGARPPAISLVLRLLHGDARGLVAVQWMVHCLAWTALAWNLHRAASRRIVGFALAFSTLATALSQQVHIWNFYVLSESLAISCLPLVFLFAGGLFGRKTRRLSVLPLSVVLVAGVCTRDVFAYLALALGVALFVVSAISKPKTRSGYVLLLVVSLAFGGSVASAEFSGNSAMEKRWVFPLLNVIGQRVLPDPEVTAEFARLGMPVDRVLMARANTWASSDGFAFYVDPQLARFREWVVSHGKASYQQFLIHNPRYTVGRLLENREIILHEIPGGVGPYVPGNYPRAPLWLVKLEANLYLAGLPLFLAGVWAAWTCRRGIVGVDTWRVALILALFVPIPVLMVVCFHGDAMEVPRHSVLCSVYVRIYCLYSASLLAAIRARNELPRACPGTSPCPNPSQLLD